MSINKKYAFTEEFRLCDGGSVTLDYGNVGVDISVDSRPHPIEDAVAKYTTDILECLRVRPESLTTLEKYEAVGATISQSDLLSKTSFISVADLLRRAFPRLRGINDARDGLTSKGRKLKKAMCH